MPIPALTDDRKRSQLARVIVWGANGPRFLNKQQIELRIVRVLARIAKAQEKYEAQRG